MQFADNIGPDQPGSSLSAYRINGYVDKQTMSRSDCPDAHAHPELRCSHRHKGLFCTLWISYMYIKGIYQSLSFVKQ